MPAEGKKEGESKDVVMKDAEKKDGKEGEKKEPKKPEPPADPRQVLIDTLGQSLTAIAGGAAVGDTRVMARMVRYLATLKRTITNEVLRVLLEETVDASRPGKATFLGFVPADVPMTEEDKAKAVEVKLPQLPKPPPPELEAFSLLLLLMRVTDKKEKDQAFEVGNALSAWLKTFNRRTLDVFAASTYFYLSLAYERKGRLQELRPELLAAYRTACLRQDVVGKATLLNLVLRNYLAYNLYEQALKFDKGANGFPETRTNAQYAKYLLYMGQIKAVQLEYSDSHSKLLQAIRKAPQDPKKALGFKLAAQKLAIIVELLMGGIPDRTTFMQKETREQLHPYFAITQAVRCGDLNAFRDATQKYEALFKKDKTLTLINRLRYNVIKAGLRSINAAYSRISLQDICTKLGLESVQDAAGVVAKAVVDGVIDATIDYDQQFVRSKSRNDLYSSCEPQKALHKRITFCLQMHNDAVKAMAYFDEEEYKGGEDPEDRRERERRELADADEEGEDDMML